MAMRASRAFMAKSSAFRITAAPQCPSPSFQPPASAASRLAARRRHTFPNDTPAPRQAGATDERLRASHEGLPVGLPMNIAGYGFQQAHVADGRRPPQSVLDAGPVCRYVRFRWRYRPPMDGWAFRYQSRIVTSHA